MSGPEDNTKNATNSESEKNRSMDSNPQTVADSTVPDNLREDLVKSAVSFLSSPKVQSAETAKKVAFLRSKGLNQKEIEEAFRRVGQDTTTSPSTNTSSTLSSNPPAPLIPQRQQAPQIQQIIYKPNPINTLPVQQLAAIAVLMGMGAAGVLAGIVGIVKRMLLPTVLKWAAYRHSLYSAQKSTLTKILESAEPSKHEQSNDDEDDTVALNNKLAKQQLELSDTIARLVNRAKTRTYSSTGLQLSQTISQFRESLTSTETTSSTADNLHTEIRTLKTICLNRR
ncbi:hypothetical protein VTP01DRAFT_886 [Rhizomucor pusillus]|uniref:uncharacterized protein n=1 Tax=Rhizomucor pusillus TaxID=4840 RepID=UPI0037446D13